MILYTRKHRVPFQIDTDDCESVSRYTWCISEGYPVTTVRNGTTRRNVRLHEFLLGKAPHGLVCDHISRDTLDNRRANLRFVTHSGNRRNTGLKWNNTSGIKGVSFECGRGLWLARICAPGRQVNLGRFHTLEAAAAARKAGEARYWR